MATLEVAVIGAHIPRAATWHIAAPRTNDFSEPELSLAEACDWVTLYAQELDDVAFCAKLSIEGWTVEIHAASGRGIHFCAAGLPEDHWAIRYCQAIRNLQRLQPYGRQWVSQ